MKPDLSTDAPLEFESPLKKLFVHFRFNQAVGMFPVLISKDFMTLR